jgi:hypothetical protein
MAELKIALFVEGSDVRDIRGRSPFEKIWNENLRQALGLVRFEPIVGITKKHLVAMDPRKPRMSGAGEGLDRLIARLLKTLRFDAAIIAWDLAPPWNPDGSFCRWEETLDLYRFLAKSDDPNLPQLWKQKAADRLDALENRQAPGKRLGAPRLEEGMILPVCMEPMFESLLVQDERAIRRALGISGLVKGWPSHGWADATQRAPDRRVLNVAIQAIGRMQPRPEVLRRVRGDFETNKHEWAEFLLRKLLADERGRAVVLAHPIARRLAEIAIDRSVAPS